MGKLTTSGLLVCTTLSWCADYRIEANIRYDHYPETVLDILQPVAPALKNRPGVIVIHGGGWIQGEKESVTEKYCVPFVQHGMVVANLEYRLAMRSRPPSGCATVPPTTKWIPTRSSSWAAPPEGTWHSWLA